jgi:dienelactone hydrolase
MFALMALVLVSGLPAEERGRVDFTPRAEEAGVPERFRLSAGAFDYRMTAQLGAPGYTVWSVQFPSPVVTPDPENNTVHAEYFRPGRPGRRPAVVVLHILGADFALSRYMAARLADRGVAALFVKLPYYGERRPNGGQKRFLSADIERTVLAMRQGVCDVRRAAAWLAARREVDPAKLGVTGISLGGIVSSVAAAVDPAISRGAFLLAGGDLARVLWEMPEGARYKAIWVESGRTLADLKALTDPFDPLTHAHRLVGKRLLMIAGKVDEVIPPASTVALWEAAGRPPITWYDCGHYSAVGFLLPGIRRTVDFFADGGGCRGARRAARSSGSRHRDAPGPAPQPEREGEQHDAEDDRVRADQPGDRHGAGHRPGGHQQAEQHRHGAPQRQGPLPLDLASEADGGDDLEDARHDRPGRDQVNQGQFGCDRGHERDHADGDADQALHQQRPPGQVLRPADDRRGDGEDAVDQGKGPVQEHQRAERDPRPDEGRHTEEDRDHAPYCESPPVPRQDADHVSLKRPMVDQDLHPIGHQGCCTVTRRVN